MRLTSLPALFLLFSLDQTLGCNNTEVKNTIKRITYEQSDTVLAKSQSNVVVMGRVSQASDSVITKKVKKTTDKMEHLTTQVQVLKKENNELKKKLNTNSDDAVDQHFGLLPISGDQASE